MSSLQATADDAREAPRGGAMHMMGTPAYIPALHFMCVRVPQSIRRTKTSANEKRFT